MFVTLARVDLLELLPTGFSPDDLQRATTAFCHTGMGFGALHMRDQLPADAQGIPKIGGG